MGFSEARAQVSGALHQASAILQGNEAIYSTLAGEHGKIMSLMDQVIQGNYDTRCRLYETVKHELIVHAKAEETTFYSLLLDRPDTRSMAERAIRAHRLIEAQLHEIERFDMSTQGWIDAFRTLVKLTNAHIEEEENILFNLAKTSLAGVPETEIDENYKIARDQERDLAAPTV